MPACPVCRDEFTDDVRICPTDNERLVPVDQLPPPPIGEAQLGLFHPRMVLLVQRFLGAKGVSPRVVEVDDQRVELWVPEPARDDLRAALTLSWAGFVGALEPEARDDLATTGGDHPGWYDPPQGAWVDDHGRLRVEPSPEEVDAHDAARRIGPAMAIVGVVVLLLSWVNGPDAGPVLLGVSLIVLGVLIPR